MKIRLLDDQMPSTFYLKRMVKNFISMRVAIEEVDVARDVCCEEPGNDILDSYNELVKSLMNENAFRMPTNPHEAEMKSILPTSLSY